MLALSQHRISDLLAKPEPWVLDFILFFLLGCLVGGGEGRQEQKMEGGLV